MKKEKKVRCPNKIKLSDGTYLGPWRFDVDECKRVIEWLKRVKKYRKQLAEDHE